MLDSLPQYYSLESKIGEGSFSEVFKVRQISTGKYFAAKRLTKLFDDMDEVDNYIELKVLKKLQFHTNVAHLIDCVYEKDCCRLTLIFNLMDLSLYDFIKDRKKKLSESRCKNYLFQLGHGLFYLHHNGIFHRDIKPENCLLRIDPVLAKTNPLRAELIQISDLGSVSYTSYPQPRTEYISTRWYRAPECLLTRGYYGPKMDVWALGCCFYEMLTLQPLFPGENEIDQLDKIHGIIGSPSRNLLEKFQTEGVDFQFPKRNAINMHTYIPMLSLYGIDVLKKTLEYHPDNRISARKLLEHVYFDDLKQKISSDTATARILYSKSDTVASRILRKSQTNVNRMKLNGVKLSASSSLSNSCSETASTKSHVNSFQYKWNYELERNWNNPKFLSNKKAIKNVKSSVIKTAWK